MKIGQTCYRCGKVPEAVDVDLRRTCCIPCDRQRKREKRARDKQMATQPPDMGWVPAWRALGLPEVRA